MAYFDVKVFNPTAKSYLNQTLKAVHRANEQMKKRSYNKRINLVDQGTFTPLVFTCFRGMSRECGVFYNRLAEMIAEKKKSLSQTLRTGFAQDWISAYFDRKLCACAVLDPSDDAIRLCKTQTLIW